MTQSDTRKNMHTHTQWLFPSGPDLSHQTQWLRVSISTSRRRKERSISELPVCLDPGTLYLITAISFHMRVKDALPLHVHILQSSQYGI